MAIQTIERGRPQLAVNAENYTNRAAQTDAKPIDMTGRTALAPETVASGGGQRRSAIPGKLTARRRNPAEGILGRLARTVREASFRLGTSAPPGASDPNARVPSHVGKTLVEMELLGMVR